MSAIEDPVKCIRRNYEYLVSSVYVSSYLDALFAEEVISFDDKDNLRHEQRELERARTFFDLLMKKPEPVIRKFFEILRTRKDKQPHIYDKLFPVACTEHQSVARTEHVQVQDERSRVAAISCQSSSSDQEAPSKTQSQLEQPFCSRPDLERSLVPTLFLDCFRWSGVLNAEEYRKLQDSGITESQRSQMLLHDILPSKGHSLVTDFCDIVHDEEKKLLEITEASPKKETHVQRSTEHVSGQQPLTSEPTGPSSSRKNFVRTGTKLAKGSQAKWVTFFFKPKHRKVIEKIEDVIGCMCSKHFGIERNQVDIYYLETVDIYAMIQSWRGQRPHPCFVDLDSKLAVSLVCGTESDQLESCKELEDFIVMHLQNRVKNPQLTLDPQECRVHRLKRQVKRCFDEIESSLLIEEETPSEAVKQAPSVQYSTVKEQATDTYKEVMEVCIQTGSTRLPKMRSEVYELNRNMKSTRAMLPHVVHRLKRQVERCYDEIDSLDNTVQLQQIQLEVAKADLNQHKRMIFQRAEALHEACKCDLCPILSHFKDSLVASYVRAYYKTMEASLCVDTAHEAAVQLTGALQSVKNYEHELEKLYKGCYELLEGLSRRRDVLMVICKEKICEQSEPTGSEMHM